MEPSFFEGMGISTWVLNLVILPIFIFLARIVDVSINTVRIIYMLHGKKWLSTMLGFFEALVWLVAIGQIFQNLQNWQTYFAYAAGFGSGIYVGMLIEDKLAIGRVVVKVITSKPASAELINFFNTSRYRYSVVDAHSDLGEVHLIYAVIKREKLKEVINTVKAYNPSAFYTVEGVKRVSDDEIADERGFLFRKKLSSIN